MATCGIWMMRKLLLSFWVIKMWEEALGGIQNKAKYNSNNNPKSGEKETVTLLTSENPVKIYPVILRHFAPS